MAGAPSAVPGTFTIRFGRSTAFHRMRALSIVPSVSRARLGQDFDRNEAILAVGRVVDWPEEIAGVLDILDGERLEDVG